jgi:hypothetical protein
MTIPEASSLILQAAAVGRPGDTLVLDMGNPIKNLSDLARDLDPARQVEILTTVPMVFTGIRPARESSSRNSFYQALNLPATASNSECVAGSWAKSRSRIVRALALELLTLAGLASRIADLRKGLFGCP